ncbi:hypothetical protein LZ906_001470 [Paraclostridium ghonii]|uniref:hypothetical protein n=1 Tax=Paraclostridium ghonii TaxID=29358 RepID=UPI00202CD3A5|nr:hypothetical protein [Paeniclostridium ghonii]MCM0166150.1 hypothetical protein [Paeniclostridium ghonii]
MLKRFYKVSILFSLLLLVFMSIPAYANSVQNTIPVTYNISEDSKYTLSINVSGDGTVYDGVQSIKNGIVIHNLKVGEEKTLRIIPDDKSEIKNISWKNKDTDLSQYYKIKNIENGKSLSLRGVSTDSELIIEFEKNNSSDDKGQNQDDSQTKDGGIKNPKTGEKGMLGWIILFILSLIIILILRSIDSKKSKTKE